MRRTLIVELVMLGLAGIAGAVALGGTSNPRGQWVSPLSAKKAILSRPLDVIECPTGNCKIQYNIPDHRWLTVRARVRSATVLGIGRFKKLGGVRHYQLFNVRVCAVAYAKGGQRVSAHMRWYTQRSPYQSPTTTTADAIVGSYTVRSYYDGGQAYGTDWNNQYVVPVAHIGC